MTTETSVNASVLVEQRPRVEAPSAQPENPTLESFRLLALNIKHLLEAEMRRSVLVMSAQPGDGRTFTAVGLAHALAELSVPLLVLDTDPVGSATRSTSFMRVVSPAKLGVSTQVGMIAKSRDVLAAAEAEGLSVVIDSPPCTRSSIAFQLAPHVGGVLYVARRRREDLRVHADVRAQLDLLGARVLGIVFNEG